ncbi:MAG: GatB/YqeY domain-containing protein [Acidobacteria bacterium]|nr:GatB/YqeY domain-containing protein [Acidobacteriota bacterium]
MAASLQERLHADLQAAVKARRPDRVAPLRLTLSQIRYAEIERRVPLSEPDLHALIGKAVRDRLEAADLYRKGGRPELAEKEEGEAALLRAYLPEPITGPALERLVDALLEELGIREKRRLGEAMKAIMERHRGRIDGAEASRLLAARLQ